MPSAKTQDDASLNELRLRRFGETRESPRTLIASIRTASIRRCSLERVCEPADSKNWLGRIVSGSGLSGASSEASLELLRITYLHLVVFRHIANKTPSSCVSSCPTTVAEPDTAGKAMGFKVELAILKLQNL